MPTPSDDATTLRVTQDDGVQRLDRFLVARLPRCSRRRAQAAIATGAVLVNGRSARKGQLVRPGDVVDARLANFFGELTAQPNLPITVLYEDEALIAVDKPAGMPSVALRPGDRGTVANALLARYPELSRVSRSIEAGLVHRLDTPTSGILAAARTPDDWQRMRAQFQARRIGKLYVAAVRGRVATTGVITAPIGHRRGRRAMAVYADPQRARAADARPAVTRYRPLRRWRDATLLAVRIPTGVRHQIRAHLASLGHPILGDATYGDSQTAAAAPRLMLHASRLTLRHPRTGCAVVMRSPLPDDFRDLLRRIERPAD